MTPFKQAKAMRNSLEEKAKRASAVLQTFPKNETGLTPEKVRRTPKWRMANAAYASAFRALQAFNAKFVRLFKAELETERTARRANALVASQGDDNV